MPPYVIIKTITGIGFFVAGAAISIIEGDWGAFVTGCVIAVVFWKLV